MLQGKAKLRCRCGAAGTGRCPFPGTTIKEACDQVGKQARADGAVEERGASDIGPTYPRKVRNHLARIDMKEPEPRLAFIAHSAVGLDANAGLPERIRYAMKMEQILPGPPWTIRTQIVQVLTHATPLPASPDALLVFPLPYGR